uniref:Uncharacterized protein n=1 Tax=Xiphophorus couchianus TaxID=32473 RepID=A0A3B5M2Q2_9TELE
MALISLDDLEGLDDEQLEDDITDNTEPMGDEEGLLSHWQAVASTHQVSVPAQMGEVLYEERRYPAGFWVGSRSGEDLYEQSISLAFMKLMRFICKENSARYLGMTVPVVSSVQVIEDGKTFEKSVETAFFLPSEFQSSAPRSLDPDISVTYREPIRVIATFYGTTTEQTVGWQIRVLRELLDPGDPGVHGDRYMVAVYDNPGAPQRRNEIWFIRR